MQSGVLATLRLLFAKIRVGECYCDLSPVALESALVGARQRLIDRARELNAGNFSVNGMLERIRCRFQVLQVSERFFIR